MDRHLPGALREGAQIAAAWASYRALSWRPAMDGGMS